MIINSRYGPLEFLYGEDDVGEYYKVLEEPGEIQSCIKSDEDYFVVALIKECERLQAVIHRRTNLAPGT